MIIVTIQDLKSCFAGVTMDYCDSSAIRGFRLMCKSDLSQLSKTPEDFRLWKIGEFDQDTGKLTAYKVPVMLADGCDINKESDGDK